MKTFIKNIKTPFLITIALLLICGIIFPLVMTGLSQVIFPHQSNGSMIKVDSKTVGSELLGQDLTGEIYMKGRPSSVDYNTYTKADKENGEYAGVATGSYNYGPTNPVLTKRVRTDMDDFLKANPTVKKEDIPTDLMSSSGSGLDPDISPKSAEIQIPRLIETTGLSEEELTGIVRESTDGKFLGIFGEETVNVLNVNLLIAEKLEII